MGIYRSLLQFLFIFLQCPLNKQSRFSVELINVTPIFDVRQEDRR